MDRKDLKILICYSEWRYNKVAFEEMNDYFMLILGIEKEIYLRYVRV